MYRGGYFDARNPVAGYAWTLASWNCRGCSYDDQFKLAESQQFYEYLLGAQQQATAIRFIDQLLAASEPRHYVPGNPFNASWWGWEDDPIPARPGERDFKEQFIEWLSGAGYDEVEIATVLDQCAPSDGPTREERIRADSFEWLKAQGVKPEEVPDETSRREYSSWLRTRE